MKKIKKNFLKHIRLIYVIGFVFDIILKWNENKKNRIIQ